MFNKELLRQKMVADIMRHPVQYYLNRMTKDPQSFLSSLQIFVWSSEMTLYSYMQERAYYMFIHI